MAATPSTTIGVRVSAEAYHRYKTLSRPERKRLMEMARQIFESAAQDMSLKERVALLERQVAALIADAQAPNASE